MSTISQPERLTNHLVVVISRENPPPKEAYA
jgi:hypothetical protein